jgi:hypothetical protein
MQAHTHTCIYVKIWAVLFEVFLLVMCSCFMDVHACVLDINFGNVCMKICMCVCINNGIFVILKCSRVQGYTYMPTYMYTYTHMCKNIYIYTYIHTWGVVYETLHTYIHTYIHTSIHTYIHTYIHRVLYTRLWSFQTSRDTPLVEQCTSSQTTR